MARRTVARKIRDRSERDAKPGRRNRIERSDAKPASRISCVGPRAESQDRAVPTASIAFVPRQTTVFRDGGNDLSRNRAGEVTEK